MKILIISQYFPPEPELKISGLARGLVKLGNEVEILTGYPNYPKGKFYDGYKIRFSLKEDFEGAVVHRLPLIPDRNRNALWRIANFLSFMISVLFVGPFKIKKPDIIWVYNPPLTLGIPASFMCFLFRASLVVEIQDMWPETLQATGFIENKLILKIIDLIGKFQYRVASAITVISEGFKRNIEQKGVDRSKIFVIENWAYEQESFSEHINNDLAKEKGLDGKFNVLYAGNMGSAQGLSNLVEAAKILESFDSIQFVLMGSGIEEDYLKEMVRKYHLSNVIFLGRLPMEMMTSMYALSDALLVHLTDDPLFEITIPGKTQSCLLSGKPVIASVNGDAANLIEKAKAGFTAEAMNPASLATAVKNLYNLSEIERYQMGLRGRSYYFDNLSPAVQVEKYQNLFEDILKRKG